MMNQLSVSELHGLVINYEDIRNIPVRNSFIEENIYKEVSSNIEKCKSLLFMPNSLHEMSLQDKKYDKSQYKIVLFGVLLDGRRATVVISGIRPYFEAVIPTQEDSNESGVALDLYNMLKSTKYATPDDFEIIKGKQFKGYQKDRKTFARFYFDKLKTRKDAIKVIRDKGYETTSDDTSSYYRVVCRDYLITFSSWVSITDYNIRSYSSIHGSVFEVNISNFKKYDSNELIKDNTMTMGWDIETYSPDGQLPKPEIPEHKMFVISMTFQWHHSNNQLLRVCLVETEADARPNYLTIVCDTEKKLIKAFGKVIHKMKPEIHIGFNDSDYDWPWLVKRGKSYPGVLKFLAECLDATIPWKNYDDESIMNYNYKKEKVKLEADAYADGYSLVFPGYINIDLRTIFRQLYPTAEQSNLNFYLALNKLGGKKDMPYQEMFEIYTKTQNMINYKNGIKSLLQPLINDETIQNTIMDYIDFNKPYLLDKMAEIADYCVIDAQRCHELMKIRSVIMDRREVANLSYTSLFDALYRANGMKVRNLVIARGQQNNIRFSNITVNNITDDGKYPGAHVVQPKKGLITSKLTFNERRENAKINQKYAEWNDVTEDEITEYVEIIIQNGTQTNEKSLRKIIEYREANNKKPLRRCFIEFLRENTGRPITGLDFSSLYPSLIMAYNLSPEYIIVEQKIARELHDKGFKLHKIKFMYNGRWVRGWSIRHENIFDPTNTDYKFGVYPMILKELFDNRNTLKKLLHKWESEKERLDALPREKFLEPDIQQEYENVCFNFNYLDSKQKALKVFMNTFYGESGNKLSPFFVLQLAGAITSAGQDNIKLVQKHVEEKKCGVMYGDTDSLYLSMPEHHFDELDKSYYSGKIDKLTYWTEMVKITFKEIEIINKSVNDMLIADNGTKFLKMAYEEALFPVAFLAKKKYYGIPHISIPNFSPKNLFIRGLEVKKRGVSEILRKVCMNIMWDSVSLKNTNTLMELVQKKIDDIYSTKWDFNDFIMTDVYKPIKQNIKIQTFVSRMISEGVAVKPYERFDYVIVKRNPYKYDERGRKKELSIGEKMEYSHRAVEQKLEIDIDYYMKGSINGQLARLITYAETFHVTPTSIDDADIKIAEDKIYNNACKFIENYCEKYYTNYQSKGKIYQKIFRIANNVVTDKIKQYCGNETVTLLSGAYDLENLEEWLEEKAEKEALKHIKGYGKSYVDTLIKDMDDEKKSDKIKELQYIYFGRKSRNFSIIRESAFKDRQTVLKRQVRDNITKLGEILNYHTKIVCNVQDKIKKVLDINCMFNSANDTVPDLADMAEYNSIDMNELENTAESEIDKLINNTNMVESLNRLRYIYINIISNYDYIHKNRSIVDYLMLCRNKNIGLINKPKSFDQKTYVKNNIDDIITELKNDNYK